MYFANLYGQLNLHFNLQEELYTHNQSLVNFALGNSLRDEELPLEERSGIEGSYEAKPYGLLTLLLAKSFVRNDTVTSASIVGYFNADKTAIHLANLSKSLSYSGKVTLIGDNQLPSSVIEPSYINNELTELTHKGKNTISDIRLPEINPNFKKIFEGIKTQKTTLSGTDKTKDSLYYNSFFNPTTEINIKTVSDVIIKGNFVLRSNDSIRVRKNSVLEDVILMAPKIVFEEGFKGSVQAFATSEIVVEQKVTLEYPSVLCLYNESMEKGKILIKKESKVTGAVVLFGNVFQAIKDNSIEIEEDGLIVGDIYCTGRLGLKSTVYGSVYTNRFFHKTSSSNHENTIANIEINTSKRPKYFIAIPLFDTKKKHYGILKKVL